MTHPPARSMVIFVTRVGAREEGVRDSGRSMAPSAVFG